MMFGTANTTDNAVALLQDLGIDPAAVTPSLKLLAATDARYLKDLKINITNSLQAESLPRKEAYLIAYAVAVNEKNTLLQEAFTAKAKEEGATDKELAEVISCTSLMTANNVYYRFRHFMHEEFYNTAPAGIRMSIMANPVLGKELFETISLVVSAVNGCEMCVTSHEKNIVLHGASKQKIHDAVRLGAVVRSLAVLL
ncbi:MAG: carboxymuconolactone decarboxylase family protein [Chitinophagaceae bacterium]